MKRVSEMQFIHMVFNMGCKRKKLEYDLMTALEGLKVAASRIKELEAKVAEYERDTIIRLNGGTYDVLEEEEEE